MGSVKKQSNWDHICKNCGGTFYRRGSKPPVYCSIECMAAGYSNEEYHLRIQEPKVPLPPGYKPIRIVAERTGYSRYALRRLVDAGKVSGKRCPYFWYVDEQSVRDYTLRTQAQWDKETRTIIKPEFGRPGEGQKKAA